MTQWLLRKGWTQISPYIPDISTNLKYCMELYIYHAEWYWLLNEYWKLMPHPGMEPPSHVKGKANIAKKMMDGQATRAECCLSECWEEYEQVTPSLLGFTHNQKEWEMSSLVSSDRSMRSIATAERKYFHLVPAATNFVSLLFKMEHRSLRKPPV